MKDKEMTDYAKMVHAHILGMSTQQAIDILAGGLIALAIRLGYTKDQLAYIIGATDKIPLGLNENIHSN